MGKHFKKKSKISKKNIISTLMLIIFFTLLVISGVEIIKWYNNNKQNQKIQNEISETITINEEENTSKYSVDFEKLKEINDQVVAWLKVNGTQVEYPVVQAKDNNYYLKRNLDKKYNVGGWIFADYKNKLDGTDKNIVVYGHNMRDGSMFGSLKNILNEEWYNNEENYIISFITEDEEQKYQVFSIYKIEKEDYYIDTEFKKNEFAKFIETLKQRSIKDFDVEITEEDSILTLSTCADNNKYRVVLHAKIISE